MGRGPVTTISFWGRGMVAACSIQTDNLRLANLQGGSIRIVANDVGRSFKIASRAEFNTMPVGAVVLREMGTVAIESVTRDNSNSICSSISNIIGWHRLQQESPSGQKTHHPTQAPARGSC
jgi:hypothetical protein